MAREMTAEQAIADIRRRANMERSKFVTDEEILEYFNQELAELRGRLRRNEGQLHAVSSATIPVTSGTSSYPIATYAPDFWELISVSMSYNGQQRMLEPFMEAERDNLANSYGYGVPMYRLMGANIEFLPSNRTFTATIRYVPRERRIELGASPPDKVDGYNGFEVAAIYGVVATLLHKEEADPSFYVGQKERILKYIDSHAGQRDAGRPERVTDVTGDLDYLPWERV